MTVTIGSILRAAHAAVRAHLGSFAVIGAALQLLPLLAFRMLVPGAGNPYAIPPALFALLLAINLLGLVAMLTFAAVAGEAEGAPPRSFGAALAASLLPLMKLVAAGLIAYLGLIVVTAVVAIVAAVGATLLWPGSSDAAATGVAAAIVVVVLLLTLALGARLAPLPGVYLFEAGGVVRGLRRGWALSRGHAGTLLLLVLFYFGLTMLLVAPILSQAMPAALSAAAADDPPAITLPAWVNIYSIAVIVPGLLLNIYAGTALGILYRQLVDAAPDGEGAG